MGKDVAVLGAGVSALTTGICAARAGWSVTLYSPRMPLETTSAKAAASFEPHLVELGGLPADALARAWAGFDAVERSAGPSAGVRRQTHWDAASVPLTDEPFLDVVEDVRIAERPDVPGGYAFGRSFTTFFVDTPIYLPWLTAELARLGGSLVLVEQPLTAADVAALPADQVVNCTGLGARELVGDDRVRPIRGQIVVVDPIPDMDWSISADGFYLYPRRGDTVVGGTAELDVEEETTEPAVVDALLRAARRVVPRIGELRVHRTYAGLRPYRHDTVRVEAEELFGKQVVHNYGHGGGGITMSWGTAELAVALL